MLLFKKHLLELVLQQRKTQTRRINKMEFKEGHVYQVKNNLYGKAKGRIKINRKFKQQLKDVTDQEAKAEGFQSLDDFKKAWLEIYGLWDPELTVTAYEFELIKETASYTR